jgi:hypothetical protein
MVRILSGFADSLLGLNCGNVSYIASCKVNVVGKAKEFGLNAEYMCLPSQRDKRESSGDSPVTSRVRVCTFTSQRHMHCTIALPPLL